MAARARRLAALLIAPALAACAAGGPREARPALAHAPLEAMAAPVPEGENQRRTAPPGWLRLPGASPIPIAHWPAEGRARAVALALHGFGDHGASTFGRAARLWSARGIEVFAPDQRGFGRTDGWRRWPGAATLVDDAVALSAAVRAARPGLPFVLIGASMGGGVALAAAPRSRPDRLLLLAPAARGGDALPARLRAAAWLAAALAPDRRWTGRGIVRLVPTDDREMLVALSQDPLHYAAPSGREFLGLVRLMDAAVAAAPAVRAPTLILHGARDEIVPPAASRALAPRLGGPTSLEEPAEAWHMLLRDRGAAAVQARAADFILGEDGT